MYSLGQHCQLATIMSVQGILHFVMYPSRVCQIKTTRWQPFRWNRLSNYKSI